MVCRLHAIIELCDLCLVCRDRQHIDAVPAPVRHPLNLMRNLLGKLSREEVNSVLTLLRNVLDNRLFGLNQLGALFGWGYGVLRLGLKE